MHYRSNNYKHIAFGYSQVNSEGIYKTVFCLVSRLIKKYDITGLILDHGCGAGRFSRFLKKTYDLNVIGVDISKDMILLAKKEDPDGLYYVIDETGLPFKKSYFDCVFQAFVLMECSTSDEILQILSNIYDVAKDNSYVFILVANVDNGIKCWPLLYRNLPDQKEIEKGFPYEVYIANLSIPVIDHYWSNVDYLALFERVGFVVDALFGCGDDVIFYGDDVYKNSKSVCFYCYCLKKRSFSDK